MTSKKQKAELSEEEKNLLRQQFSELNSQARADFLSSLSNSSFKDFVYSNLILRPDQVIPEGNWRYCILLTGRGWGKTLSASQWIADKKRAGCKKMAIVAPTFSDLTLTMIPAIQERFPPKERPVFEDKNKLVFPDGTEIHCFTLETERSRGGNYEYVWIDEIVKACDSLPDKIKERFDTLDFAVRIGKAQILISTTPKPFDFIFKWEDRFTQGDPSILIKKGSILDNPYLAKGAKDALLERYKDSVFGRQELHGDTVRETPGAYWTHDLIDRCRDQVPITVPKPSRIPSNDVLMGRAPKPDPNMQSIYKVRTLIGFDPSVSKGGDECGIIVGSLYSNNKAYILGDYSGKYDPGEYAKLIDKLYRDYQASGVVVETNIAGNTLAYTLRSVNSLLNIITRHVSDGKTTRAEHCSSLYHQGKVYHTSNFKLLEDQMCSFNVNYSKSPDRVDSLGLLLTELFWPGLGNSSLKTIPNIPGYK